MQSEELRMQNVSNQSRESHRAVEAEQSFNPFDRSVTVAARMELCVLHFLNRSRIF